jgi:hypothetical protein
VVPVWTQIQTVVSSITQAGVAEIQVVFVVDGSTFAGSYRQAEQRAGCCLILFDCSRAWLAPGSIAL